MKRGPAGIALLFGILAGCQGAEPAAHGLVAPAACAISDDEPRDNLTVAAGQAVDPDHAPAPRNAAERLVFGQLYETLVRVDCEGRVVSGLAESWEGDEEGRVWQFRLRAEAVFWDGSQVSARDIAQSWVAYTASAARASSTFASVTALSERDLRVELPTASVQANPFAHPDLAIARRGAGGGWPIGSGPFRVDANPDAGNLRIVSRAALAPARQSLEFRAMESTDVRRALDAGVDAVITGDAAALEYARALPGYKAMPLIWSRTYAIVTRAPANANAADSANVPPPDALIALARDAVRADTRAAVPPFWWHDAQCRTRWSARAETIAAGGSGRAIVYPRADAVAQAIAERLAALAWPAANAPAWLRALLPDDYSRSGTPTAQGLDDRALLDALRTNRVLAAVVPLPRIAGTACVAPGLANDAFTRALATASTLRITPLLDARDHLIHRRGIGRVVMDGDGTIRFNGGQR